MTPEQLERVGVALSEAVQREASDRESYVRDACADDHDVRDEVCRLLPFHSERPIDDAAELVLALRVSAGLASTTPFVRDDGESLPTSWGPLEKLELVGEGGFGQTFRAWDPTLQRHVALKLFRREAPGVDDLLAEGRLLARIQRHPNVVTVHNAETHDGRIGLWMEFIEGKTLADVVVETGPMSEREAAIVGMSVCGALAMVHHAGIIHRDIKPANVMRATGGAIVLVDFGLGVEMSASASSSLAGTRYFMAPELFAGAPPTRASDIYGVGALLYFLVTRKIPMKVQTGTAGRSSGVPSLYDERPSLSESFVHVVETCLSERPEDRYDTTGALRADLARTVAITKRPSMSWRRRVALLVAMLVVVTSVALVAFPDQRTSARRLLGVAVLPSAKHVAVLPVSTPGGDATLDKVARGLTTVITTELEPVTRDTTIQLVPARVVENSYNLPEDARRGVGANLAVATTLKSESGELLATIDLIDTTSGRRLDRVRVRSPVTELIPFTREVIDRVGETLSDLPRPEAEWPYTHASGAFREYLNGAGEMYRAPDTLQVHRAIDHFKRAISIDPGFVGAQIALSSAWRRMNKLTGDRRWLELAESANEAEVVDGASSSRAYEERGRVFAALGRDDEAIAALEHAISIGPPRLNAYVALARVAMNSGRLEVAERAYAKLLESRPHFWRGHYWLGVLAWQKGDMKATMRHFARSGQFAGDNTLVLESLGGLFVLEGRYDEAIPLLERSIGIRPTQIAFSNLGTAYFNQRDFERAMASYQQAFQFGSDRHELWINLGDAYFFGSEHPADAESAYRRAIELARDGLHGSVGDAPVLAQMANVYARLSEPDSARTSLEAALTLNGSHPTVLYCAADVSWILGDRPGGLDFLERAIEFGYPVKWIRDSAVFDSWREDAAFQALVRPQ